MEITEKYGKAFDNKAILRTPEWIANQCKRAKQKASKFSHKKRKILKKCPMCESENLKDFTQIYDFNYKECKECENLFLSNPLENLIELYTNDGSESSYECYLDDEIFFKRLKLISKPKVEFIDTIAKDTKQNETWLDIGSGGGENLYAAKKLGYKIKGFESDTKAVKFSSEKLEEKCISEGFLDIKACDDDLLDSIKKSSVITFFNVLEHLEHPKETLHFFGKHMKKDALLAIEVPRHPSLASYANFLTPDKIYRHCIAPYHLNIFSEKSIEMAATGGGA